MSASGGIGAQSAGGDPRQGMNNLTTLIKRLEAATSRLEDIANSAGAGGSPSGSVDHNFEHPNGLSGDEKEKDRGLDGGLQGGSRSEPELPSMQTTQSGEREASAVTVGKVGSGEKKEDLPESVQAMDELITEHVAAFVESSKGVDPLVEEQAKSVTQSFSDQRRFLLTSTKSQKPDPQSKTFMDLLSDLQHHMGSISDIRETNRGSPMKDHLAMVGEGITALQWLIMEGKPAEYVGEVIGGAQMYGNRVLKAYKEGDQDHVKYVRAFYTLLQSLKSYIQKHYPSGVTWNANGEEDALQVYQNASPGPISISSSNGVSSTGAPPPPPPPPPLPNFDNQPPSSSASSQRGIAAAGAAGAVGGAAAGGDMGAVFEQLNKGESVTSGLKKVDKSQMTHKNPSLRAGGTVPSGSGDSPSSSQNDISRSRSPGPEVKPKPASMRQNSSASLKKDARKGPPKKELDGNKWLIENYDSPSSPLEIEVSLSQSILITKCSKTTIILKGKANAISIDNSPKCQILVESLVSSIDVIKCPNFAVQITGTVPTVMLDQVDGASIYLSKETSETTEIFTSKCSGINVVLPPEEAENADSTEHPLPEQIRTVVKGGKLVSEIVEHAG